MPKSNAAWGIDVGQCALKALRCRLADDKRTLIAEAFDYIEYPKILSQPDAEPEVLVREALEKFLNNNSVRDARVAIAVPGQAGLARFIKLPPVDPKKIPDIVKYEAKQQIPFALEDVIWDYQPILGGVQEEGNVLETEVGLFAMKREQVFRTIRPFRDADVELDVVQLTPIGVYNAVAHGILTDLPDSSQYDPENPPDWVVVVSMGTETTDLVITNGFRIWQRSIPIGGSHFTKQLMREMKLTFAKAEQLKRNARQAPDPKAVFQAMRPVFSDMVQELQRSIGYFRSIERNAQISHAIAMGNAMRLPGLQPYLEKNLDLKVQAVDHFENLTGSAVLSAPKFRENILSFGVCYGLCLQAQGGSRLNTNLIPRELVTARIIRRKKPWAVAALTLLVAGLFTSYLLYWYRWSAVHESRYQTYYQQIKTLQTTHNDYISEDEARVKQFDYLKRLGNEVVGNAEGRFLVLELFSAIDAALPCKDGEDFNTISKLPYSQRPQLHIEYIDSEFFPSIETYFTQNVQDRYKEFRTQWKYIKNLRAASQAAASPAAEPQEASEPSGNPQDPPVGSVPENPGVAGTEATDTPAAAATADSEVTIEPLTGPGWVIEIQGYHFYEADPFSRGKQHVINTLLSNLENGQIQLPAGPGQQPVMFRYKELGIRYPIIAAEQEGVRKMVPNPAYVPPARPQSGALNPLAASPIVTAQPTAGSGTSPISYWAAYQFTVQFVWQETRASERLEKRRQQQTTSSTEVADRG